MAIGMDAMIPSITKQPLPETIFPIFLWRPLLVRGTPILREIRDFAADIPIALFHENPPKPIF